MKVCLFGAAPDSGNLGVTALCHGTLYAILTACPGAEITVFDFGRGVREEVVRIGALTAKVGRCGAYLTRRLYRRESLANIEFCARFGGLGNPGARSLLAADLVLDISGGDSFADIYGPRRFAAVAGFKEAVLKSSKRLVLLPQTYGPFNEPSNLARACRIIEKSTMAWSRDTRSFERLRELVGSQFDADKHRCGVDVAFALPAQPAPSLLPQQMRAWIADAGRPIVGLNVSGLILNDPSAASRYGLKADYRAVLMGLMKRLLTEAGARIVLIPHVLGHPGSVDSDVEATDRLAGELTQIPGGSVTVVHGDYGPAEAKWVISQCDWFCGTRMHSTIGSLSMGVPTAAIAYSIKTLGVFETCGQGVHVADLRTMTADEVLHIVWSSWQNRGAAQLELEAAVPQVRQLATEQMRTIVQCIWDGQS